MSESPMKDSGIDWIGQVPEGWEVSRVGTHFSIQIGKMLSPKQSSTHETLEKYICAANVHYDGVSGEKKEMWFSTAEKDAYRIKVGDMLVVEGGAGAGGCAVVEKLDGDTYFQNSILRLRGECFTCNRYLCYWFQQLGQRGYVAYACNVATIPHFTKEKMRQVPMPVPPLPVQRKIVAYLDEKTAAIDARVAVLEKKLAAYKRLRASVINRAVTRGLDPKAKLKDSGVDWIGKVPEGWIVDKIGNCFDVIGSGTTPRTGSQDLYEGDIPWVQSGDLHGDWVIETSKRVNKTALQSYSLPIYKAPFICVAMYGASIGNVSKIGVDACTNQACCALCKPRPEIDLGFMFYLLQRSQQRFLIFAEGGTQPNINRGTITGLRVGLPPLPEQRAIADYLDAECAKIDKMAELVTREIELYKKLKRSLINEVVTGKRPVFADKPLRRGKEVA